MIGTAILQLLEQAWFHWPEEKPASINYSDWAQGGKNQSKRLAVIASVCAMRYPGNLVEIGCFRGQTTVELLKVAKQYSRRVIAVDSWQVGTQDCYGGEYEEFLKNVEPYKDHLEIIRSSSMLPEVIEKLKATPICFAFIDGLHTYEAVASDIESVRHCQGVIAVDDISWNHGVRTAFFEAGWNKLQVRHPALREGYLLPLE